MKKSETKITAIYEVDPSQLNFNNTLHGGELYKWMDQMAGNCIKMITQGFVMTKAVHRFIYHRPSFLKDRVQVTAVIDRVGNTSAEVYVRATINESSVLLAEGYFTMVSVNEDLKPQPMPKITFDTQKDLYYNNLSLKRQKLYRKIESLERMKKGGTD